MRICDISPSESYTASQRRRPRPLPEDGAEIGVGAAVGAEVGASVGAGIAVGTEVWVGAGVDVAVGTSVAVGTGLGVLFVSGVLVGSGVLVIVGSEVAVCVGSGEEVGVGEGDGDGGGVTVGSGVPSKLITMTGASPAIGGSVVGSVENIPAGGAGVASEFPAESSQEASTIISKTPAASIR